MNLAGHLDQLRRKHADLGRLIEQEERRPGADNLEIKRLKREKLKLKEEIEKIEPRLH
ncbi:MAG: YdcH family protein [Pseudomonadota bacterium]